MKLIIAIVFMLWSIVSTTYAQINVQPISPQGSTSALFANDCGLSITNRWLLTKIHWEDWTIWLSASDITTAYNWTVGHPECWWSRSQLNEPSSSNFIDNLCTIAILKLENQAEQYGLQSFSSARLLQQMLTSYGTSITWWINGIVIQEALTHLGNSVQLWVIDKPDRCGIIPTRSGWNLLSLYANLGQAIYHIATDCSTSIPYTPGWMNTRIASIWQWETPYVFWAQQRVDSITTAVDRCQQQLQQSQQRLFSQIYWIQERSSQRYTSFSLESWVNYTKGTHNALSDKNRMNTDLINSTHKQTPTTPFCEAKGSS